MCTLTIIAPAPGAFVLAFNRDEHPTRAELPPSVRPPLALPPSTHGPSRRFIAPTDGLAGGTWIAVNDAGLAFALLNRNEPGIPDGRTDGTTRGSIVPALADAAALDEVASRLDALAARVTRGFRLVATDGVSVLEAVGGAGQASISRAPLGAPFLRTSSGLGDDLVRGPRAELFAQCVAPAAPAERTDAQRRFHLHRWPDRAPLSVLMDRDGARTVSHTRIEVDAVRVRLAHALRDGDDGFGPEHALELDRR